MTPAQSDPQLLRDVAEQLATEAAEFVVLCRQEVFGDSAGSGSSDGDAAVRTKSTPTDPVTIVDTETERLLRTRIGELRPGERILGEEEGGPGGSGDGELTWVLDPIDGTVNFLYGIPAFAVSVGVQRHGVSVAGAVADVAGAALYSAARGCGAHVRRGGVSQALSCSGSDDLSTALIGTGFSYERSRRQGQGEVVARLLPQVRDLRRIGSCALDLCMVAAGRLDGYYEDGVQLWDWAAGALIAAEAGAHVRLPTRRSGVGMVVAAGPGISAAFDDLLLRCGATEAP
ncbi:inositol monophosphatase family protein [Mycobacterium sp. SMC-4]|uniref:inositol monophosphatase family protein n=1 Tax=Mycobacterium sp. SMC-4 TaxID=2857059 RepID=UPI0021B3A158|nr:inositol monophosphatase family protein [Mycobacterium sp. SMC-4]UXA20006.1 inositol monophosphatase [Mycobacterium sp. SMC-4]